MNAAEQHRAVATRYRRMAQDLIAERNSGSNHTRAKQFERYAEENEAYAAKLETANA